MKFDLKSILSIAGIIGGALIGVGAVRKAASCQDALPEETDCDNTEDEKTEEIEAEASETEEK